MVPALCYLFHCLTNEEQKEIQYFTETLVLTGIGMFFEMLSEPAYILAQNLQHYKLR